VKSTVLLRRADRDNPLPAVRELLEGCGWRALIPEDASVVIKPNLCTERPEQIHTANTSCGVLKAVCEVLRERTSRITIVESDGARYPAEAAFENNGVYRLATELGVKVLNLSKDELVDIPDLRLKGFGMDQIRPDVPKDCSEAQPVRDRCQERLASPKENDLHRNAAFSQGGNLSPE
jgi:uncharacterized protein (DUF362 family)